MSECCLFHLPELLAVETTYLQASRGSKLQWQVKEVRKILKRQPYKRTIKQLRDNVKKTASIDAMQY